ncbi:nitroreductase/quinone reductase family protein [Streptomyces sp. NBC_01102]|uniref:nitroreductase/quinone reductase family protein n=1 Tax=Streptomyces sp. NBC_01102 TaxID=2903749 RepID=UPI0038691E53|nr:nitroreductase/quinone reductase family protein [Streptomyces sp. NBC_01102]
MPQQSHSPYYRQGNAFTVRMNSAIGWLARHGFSLLGTAEMSVRGRKSGQMQRIPVNPHTYEGVQYLVSARGHSQWVRNMRVAGGGELRVGRKVRTFTAQEIADGEQKMLIVRAYLDRWGWEVNQYFQGITAKSTDAALLAACPDHPVFRISIER